MRHLINTRCGAFLAERLGMTCVHEFDGNHVRSDIASLIEMKRSADAGESAFVVQSREGSVWTWPFLPMEAADDLQSQHLPRGR